MIFSRPGGDLRPDNPDEESIYHARCHPGLNPSPSLASDMLEYGARSFAARMSYHVVDSGIIDNEDAKFKKPKKDKPAAE
jgi:hypothetical protein